MPAGRSCGNSSFLQPAVAHRRDVVVERPGLGLVLDAEVEDARLQRLAQHRVVAEVVVAHAVEVVLADVDRQICAPSSPPPARRRRSGRPRTGRSGRDRSPAAAPACVRSKSRPSHQCFGRIGIWPTISGNSRLPASLKTNLHRALADLLGPVDGAVVEAVERLALGLQGLEREDHVVDGDRPAVVPARLGAQGEDHPRAVLRPFDASRRSGRTG